MVDVLFLGTGGAFAAGARSNLALLIEAPDFRMLVESGPSIVQQLARAGLSARQIDRLFVSHRHGDHSLGFPMLALGRFGADTPFHIYAGASTIAALKSLWHTVNPGFEFYIAHFSWHALSEAGAAEQELAPGVTLRTAVVPHPLRTPTLAARWEFAGGPAIAFVTDTYYCDAAIDLARGADLLIHEATFSRALQPDENPAEKFHSTAQQAGEVARRAGCPQLALVHVGIEAHEHAAVLAEEARAGTDLMVHVPDDGDRMRVTA